MEEFADKISLYLPQYLSDPSRSALIDELKRFPTDRSKASFYTCALSDVDYLLQGDGISDAFYVWLPDLSKTGNIKALLLSNTCDMSLDNQRINPCRVMYVPLINFEKYAQLVNAQNPSAAENHLKDIKAQHVTQAMFLPKGQGLDHDAIAFFDQVISLPLTKDLVQQFCTNRMFTLSNFGLYLLLLKLSIHFTRIQERIDRETGIDMGLQDIK